VQKPRGKKVKRRGPTGYELFCRKKREEWKDKGVKFEKFGDVSKACGAEWKKLSDEEKQKHKDDADAIKNVSMDTGAVA